MRDFNYTLNVLVKAYLNDTLEHGFCTACAVGNIVADAIGDKPKKRPEETPFTNRFSGIPSKYLIGKYLYDEFEKSRAIWQNVFETRPGAYQYVNPENYKGEVKEQIDATGYTWQELARIEKAFETAEKGNDAYTWMFNGLMAVVDVLADIHGIDLKVREEAKSLFVKA